MKKFTLLTCLVLIAAFMIGCETVPENNNTNNAIVTNDNTEVETNAETNETADGDWDWDMTRENYDKDKAKYEERAKKDYADDSWGTGANDSWLWFKTRAALATVDDLRDSTINVDVNDGVITLKGTVGTAAQKDAAAKAAEGIEDKKSVKNELKVAPADSVTNTTDADDKEANANTNK